MGSEQATTVVAVTPEQLSFRTLCECFNLLEKYGRNWRMKKKILHYFMNVCLEKETSEVNELVEVVRLLVPELDERRVGAKPGGCVGDSGDANKGRSGSRGTAGDWTENIMKKTEWDAMYLIGVMMGKNGDVEYMEKLYRWKEKDDLAVVMGEATEWSQFLEEKVLHGECCAETGIEQRKREQMHTGMGHAAMKKTIPEKSGEIEEKKKLNIRDVNGLLDEMNGCDDVYGQAEILKKCTKVMSAREMRWFLQLFIRQLKVFSSEDTILHAYHDLAAEYMMRHGESGLKDMLLHLRKVPQKGDDDGVEEEQNEERMMVRRVVPGVPLRQQHSVVMKDLDDVLGRGYGYWKPGYRNRVYGRPWRRGVKRLPALVEMCFDGIRVQVHVTKDKGVLYFSRHGAGMRQRHDLRMMDVSLMKALQAKECIVEGILVLWNTTRRRFETKSMLQQILKKREMDEIVECDPIPESNVMSKENTFLMASYSDLELVYIVFDILHDGDEQLVDQSLEERVEALEASATSSVVKRGEDFPLLVRIVPLIPDNCILENVVASKLCKSAEDVRDFMETVEGYGCPGIVVKTLDATWKSLGPSYSWVIIDHLYYVRRHIHVIVLGGWYAASNSMSSHLLLGLWDNEGEQRSRVVPILKISTTLSTQENIEIMETLHRQSSNSDFYDEEDFRKRISITSPDLWIDNINQAIVITIVADFHVASDRVRDIKLKNTSIVGVARKMPPTAATGAGELYKIFSKEEQARDRARDRDSHIPYFQKRELEVYDMFLPCDLHGVETKCNLLDGKIVHFLNHSTGPLEPDMTQRREDKYAAEVLVRQLGGIIYQCYCAKVDYIVAGHQSDLVDLFKEKSMDVLNMKWLKDALHYQKLPEITEEYKKLDEIAKTPRNFAHLFRPVSVTTGKQLGKVSRVQREGLIESRTKRQKKPSLISSDTTSSLPLAGSVGTPSEQMDTTFVEGFSGDMYVFSFLVYQVPLGSADQGLQFDTERLKILSKNYGASVRETLSDDTTHVIVVGCPGECDPETVLALLWQQHGGNQAIHKLKNLICEEKVSIVSSSWLLRCFSCFDEWKASTSFQWSDMPSSSGSLAVPPDVSWPWDRYLTMTDKEFDNMFKSDHQTTEMGPSTTSPGVGEEVASLEGWTDISMLPETSAPSVVPTSARQTEEKKSTLAASVIPTTKAIERRIETLAHANIPSKNPVETPKKTASTTATPASSTKPKLSLRERAKMLGLSQNKKKS